MYVQSAEMKKTFEEALKHEKERFQVIMSVSKMCTTNRGKVSDTPGCGRACTRSYNMTRHACAGAYCRDGQIDFGA
jgi:hypothetical protein